MEGLSLALLDVMGAGLCVLTSDVPENREVVEGAGFTFRAGNSADSSERLRFLLENPSLREAAGHAARKRIEEEYQWEKLAGDIEEVYLQTVGTAAAVRSRKNSVSRAPLTSRNEMNGRRPG